MVPLMTLKHIGNDRIDGGLVPLLCRQRQDVDRVLVPSRLMFNADWKRPLNVPPA